MKEKPISNPQVVYEKVKEEYNRKFQLEVMPPLGFGYEFLEREDGYPGLAKTYGLSFAKPPQQMELGLMYKALTEKKVDLIAANSTDGLIPVLKLVILEDDKQYFPPYQAVPVFNQATLEKYPELRGVIEGLAGEISTVEMQKMNYQVDNQFFNHDQQRSILLRSGE